MAVTADTLVPGVLSAQDVIDRWVGGQPPSDREQLALLLVDTLDEFASKGVDLERAASPQYQLRLKRRVVAVLIRHLRNPEYVRVENTEAGSFTWPDPPTPARIKVWPEDLEGLPVDGVLDDPAAAWGNIPLDMPPMVP